MSEILFRAKRTDNGKWVYGSLLIQTGERINKDELTPDEYRILGCRGENYLVNPKTVGQYTGLTDKNGTKIFEGDILSGHLDELFPEDESRYPVVWHDYGWHIKCGNKSFDTLEQWWVAKFLEVIGNIHDNPELLERGAKNE